MAGESASPTLVLLCRPLSAQSSSVCCFHALWIETVFQLSKALMLPKRGCVLLKIHFHVFHTF